jgi:hypothetical protein
MVGSQPHEEEKLLRYVGGGLPENEQAAIEEHLASCEACRQFVSFVQDFDAVLQEAKPVFPSPGEACPDASLIVDLEAGQLDEETAQHLRAHLLFCRHCLEEYFALRRARHAPAWTEVILRAARGALECLSIAGSGILAPLPDARRIRDVSVSKTLWASRAPTVRIEDTVSDLERGVSSKVYLRVESDPLTLQATIVLRAEPAQADWKAYLLDVKELELASMPVGEGATTLGSNLPLGSYTVRMRKGEEELARFCLEIRGA